MLIHRLRVHTVKLTIWLQRQQILHVHVHVQEGGTRDAVDV